VTVHELSDAARQDRVVAGTRAPSIVRITDDGLPQNPSGCDRSVEIRVGR